MPVDRITLFKVVDTDDIPYILESLGALKQNAVKNGTPYLIRAVAGRIVDDSRSQGYHLCMSTSFATLDDMKHYDELDEAHADIKNIVKPKLAGPPLTVYMENVVGS